MILDLNSLPYRCRDNIYTFVVPELPLLSEISAVILKESAGCSVICGMDTRAILVLDNAGVGVYMHKDSTMCMPVSLTSGGPIVPIPASIQVICGAALWHMLCTVGDYLAKKDRSTYYDTVLLFSEDEVVGPTESISSAIEKVLSSAEIERVFQLWFMVPEPVTYGGFFSTLMDT